MSSQPITLKRAAYLGLTFVFGLLLTNACTSKEAQPGWVTIDATLSVDNLENLVSATEEPASPITMSLSEAKAQLPFAFGLPAWVPEGFVLQDDVEAVLPTNSSAYSTVILTWQNAAEDEITLQVYPTTEQAAGLVGGGNVETVQVNGQPATLIHSGLKATTGRLSLRWERNRLTYLLSGNGEVISAQDLMRMAEAVSE